MDAHEIGAEFFRECFERFVDEVLAAFVFHRDVLLIGQKVVDILDRDESQLLAQACANLLPLVFDLRGLGDLHQAAGRDARRMP